MEARAVVQRIEDSRGALHVHRDNRPRDAAVDFAERVASTLATIE